MDLNNLGFEVERGPIKLRNTMVIFCYYLEMVPFDVQYDNLKMYQ